jgi:hypothetical protein
MKYEQIIINKDKRIIVLVCHLKSIKLEMYNMIMHSVFFSSAADFSEMYEDAKKSLVEGGEKLAEVAADELIEAFLDALGIPDVSKV